MPPNNIIPRRILTRRSKDANVEVSSVAQELPFVSANSRSEIPSSRVPTSSTSPHLHEDTQGYESESSLSIPENSTVSVSTKKRGRGATTGKSIEKAITENKGQLLEIEFPEGFKKPRQFANHLATGIGVVVRYSPELDCMSNWSDLAEHEKLPIYAGLDTWFNIKGWGNNPVVQSYMEEMFQKSYTHWKGRLSGAYKRMIEEEKDPKACSPFDWIELRKWRTLCDYYETENFKKRSKANESNRKLLPYTHTSGSKSFHTRLLQMENQSYVDNFAMTHKRNDTFVNEKAANVHVEMENMRNGLNQNESITSEREIVNKVLGKRSGYEKGLGYGVVPSKCSKRSTCESSQLETVQEKLSVTEDELKDATCRIKSQQELIQTQEALIQNYDDRCKKQDDEIQGLREGQDELKQMLLRLLQQNSSSNQDKL